MVESMVVRRALLSDLPQVAALAGALVRAHHEADPGRFLLVPRVEEGYERFFSHEIARHEAVILVAARADSVEGYAYGALEGRDWNLLLDTHGAIHDVFVSPSARRGGVSRELLQQLIAALETLGAERIVLSTMVKNENAQRLFQSLGFRPTMFEMTRS